MRLRCSLKEIRGRRTLAEIAAVSEVPAPYLSQVERGERVPKDGWIEGMERAYGQPIQGWYPARTLLVLLDFDEDPA